MLWSFLILLKLSCILFIQTTELSRKNFEKCFKISKYCFKRWFWSKLSFFINKDAKKKRFSLSSAWKKRTSETPIGEKRNLKICDEVLRISQEFPEKYSWEILRNFLRKIPKKFYGISQNLFSYLIPLKIRKFVTKFW